MDSKLLPIFTINAGINLIYQKNLKQAKLRIAYIILYHTGLRINEIRKLTETDINRNNAVKSSHFNIIHFKTKQSHIHVLSSSPVKNIKKRNLDCQVVFSKYKYKYLFEKEKFITEKSLIRTINSDLKHTCEAFNLPYNIKPYF